MGTPVKIYCLDGGRLEFDLSVYDPTLPKGTRGTGPVPMFLITHPKGLVLVDTGCHPNTVTDPHWWGGLSKAMTPTVAPNQVADQALAGIGVSPSAVRFVVNTHLHMDHAGGNQLFPDAEFLVQRMEGSFAGEQEGRGYFRADWDHALSYRWLDEDTTDVFGDGAIRLLRTGGHSPGHQMVAVRLRTREVIIAADVVPFAATLGGAVPRNSLDPEATLRAIRYLSDQQEAGALILFGHDQRTWTPLPKPPGFLH